MKRFWLLFVTLSVSAAALAQPACARQQQSPQELVETGRYEDAITALRNPSDVAARRLLVRALIEVGRYDEAIAAALNGGAPEAVSPQLAVLYGQALYTRGKRAEAEAAFERAARGNSADAMQARVKLAIAKWDRGATDGEIFLVLQAGTAPKFEMKGYKGKIPDPDLWNIVNYLRTLTPKR